MLYISVEPLKVLNQGEHCQIRANIVIGWGVIRGKYDLIK